jgi:CheY-like chemotaxis protein
MPHSSSSPTQAERPTVLVVDDDDATLVLCKRILQEAGCAVLSASGSSEALKLCKGHQGSIDLLVTDLVLPPPEFFVALVRETMNAPPPTPESLQKDPSTGTKGADEWFD